MVHTADHFPIMRASTRYGNGSGEILLDNLKCSGQESSLFNCPGNEIWDNNCDHSEDAGVVCNGKLACQHTDIYTTTMS